MQPVRVSSSLTLFLRIFIPTIWVTFFGVLTGFIVLFGGSSAALLGQPITKTIALVLFFGGLVLIYYTLLRLKRVELSDEHFFVTNYFKTFRYTYNSLKDIHEIDLLICTLIVFEFKTRSAFGSKACFVSRPKVWKNVTQENANLFADLFRRGKGN